jgi:hypothetical protein
MKKSILTFALLGTILTTKAQDTTKIKSDIQSLSIAANIISQRPDISIQEGLKTLNLIQSIIQTDLAILERERRKKK